MSQSQNQNMPPAFDPAMWQQFFQQMIQNAATMQQSAQRAAGGQVAATPPGTFDPSEFTRQMQNAFLDGLAKWCDDYLRSPQFLDTMKKSLDTSLAMRREMQEFLQKASGNAFGETVMSQTDPAGAIRATEERLTERIEEVSRRLDSIENALGNGTLRGASRKSSTKKTTKKKKKTSTRRTAR